MIESDQHKSTSISQAMRAWGPAIFREARIIFQRLVHWLRSEGRNMWTISKALVSDHDLFVNSLAVKGAVSSVVLGALLGISALAALPFVVAASAIAFSIVLIGFGIYGAYVAAIKLEINIRNVLKEFYPALSLRPRGNAWVFEQYQRLRRALKGSTVLQTVAETRSIKAFFSSKTWKNSQKVVARQEQIVIGGLAAGGSVVSVIIGLAVLISQFIAVPLIAGGSLLTSAILGLGYLVLGILGSYFSVNRLQLAIDAWRNKVERAKFWRRTKV